MGLLDSQKVASNLQISGPMSACRPPVALQFSSRATQTISIPLELEDYVVSMHVYLPYTTKDDIAALARLLNVCKNLQYLIISSRNLSGLTSQLTQSFPRLHEVHFVVDSGLSSSELNALLRAMPNLRQASFPPTLNAFDDDLGPFRFDFLSLEPWHRTALPLLFSGRWKARRVTLCVSDLTWRFLERTDWDFVRSQSQADTVALNLNFRDSRNGGPALAVSFIAAFRALRRLRLRAPGADLQAMLPGILRCCPGLRLLDLYFYGSKSDHIAIVAKTMLDALPGALGSVELSVPYAADLVLFKDIRKLCRAHRITCTIEAQTSGSHRP